MADLYDELWSDSWTTWYDTYFMELLAEPLEATWGKFDLIARILVTTTTSGSAVAGWQLWQEPGYKTGWVIIAGIASLASLIHSAFQVSSKVKYWSEAKGNCSKLRHKLQILRYRIKTEPGNINKLNDEYLIYKDNFAKLDASIVNSDLFMTEKLKVATQSKLDSIVTKNGTSQLPNHD